MKIPLGFSLSGISLGLCATAIEFVFIRAMEIERHLFRISERTLKSPKSEFWFTALFYCFSFLGVVFGLFLLFGHAAVLPTNQHLSKCLIASQHTPSQDTIYFLTQQALLPSALQHYQQEGKLLSDNDNCTIVLNKNATEEDEGRQAVAWDVVGLFMDKQKRSHLNFDNATVILKTIQPLRRIIFGFDVLLTNELIVNPLGVFPSEPVMVTKSRSVFAVHQAHQTGLMEKVWRLGKVIVLYLMVSATTVLYIYGTIVAAPAMIILVMRSCNFMRGQGGMGEIFKLFPWIGVHAVIRDASPTPRIRDQAADICKALLIYFFFLYTIYYATIIWVDRQLFLAGVEVGLQEMLFGFVALTQFAAIIFMRTRTFLKYYPTLHSLTLLLLLYYLQSVNFGFQKLACATAFSLSLATFCWMILSLEIPAQTVWSPDSPNTPTDDRPRAAYFPLFSMAALKTLSDEWTLMMPVFGRQNFATRELSLVDRNNEQLGAALGNN